MQKKRCLVYLHDLRRLTGTQKPVLCEGRMDQLLLLQFALLNPKQIQDKTFSIIGVVDSPTWRPLPPQEEGNNVVSFTLFYAVVNCRS